MTTGSQSAPLSDDELLYRRVPKSMGWYRPGQFPEVVDDAFHPRNDTTGLSMERARSDEHPEFKSIEEMAQGPSPAGYVVAVLRVADLRKHGIRIEPRTEMAGPGHVELPDLNRDNRKSDQALTLKRILSLSVVRVEDPFPSAGPSPTPR